MFEEIEKANDGREMILAPQNHPTVFLGFVWDTTQVTEEVEGRVLGVQEVEGRVLG